MILGRTERQRACAVAQHEKRRFAADEQLFDDDAVAGMAEPLVGHHAVHFRFGVAQVRRNDDAFAGSQAVGLEHDRERELAALEDRDRLRCRIARSVSRGRHVVAVHELLGEDLARLEPGGALHRSEQQIAARLERIRDPATQRQFGADNREIDLFAAHDLGDGTRIRRIDGNAARDAADAGISGSTNDLGNGAFGGQFPRQSVFAPPAADNQNSRETHVLVVNSWI